MSDDHPHDYFFVFGPLGVTQGSALQFLAALPEGQRAFALQLMLSKLQSSKKD